MFSKPIKELSIKDIEDLVAQRKEDENNYLEYKQNIETKDSFKGKILRVISGFANAKGGYLIFGIKESRENESAELVGISRYINGQKVEEWLNNILIANLDERVNYSIKIVNISEGNPSDERIILVLYVPESPKKPHMITFKGKNAYYLRHNKSVNIATHSEVREMFEYSKNQKDDFNKFLSKRNLIDSEDIEFGNNRHSKRLFIKPTINTYNQIARALYSFIPIYLDKNRVKTVSEDYLEWLKNHNRGYNLFTNYELYNIYEKEISLEGICFHFDYEPNKIMRYFELLNNGFIEFGNSDEIAIRYSENGRILKVIRLTAMINFLVILLQFAEKYYKKISYFDELFFQLSLISTKDYALGNFSREGGYNPTLAMKEPFEIMNRRPPLCQIVNVKIDSRFYINELDKNKISEIAYYFAEKVSNAFGLLKVNYYLKDFD